jgi:hypothetical protein
MQNVRVYRIINFNGATPTCLDGYGGGGAAGTSIDSYGCDPNQVNQTNQLWIAQGPTLLGNNLDGGQDYSILSPTLQASAPAGTVIESLASLDANGWSAYNTPVMSAAVDNINGYNSTLQLLPSTQWPVDSGNSTFILVDPNAKTVSSGSGSGSGTTVGCQGMACLLNF